MCSRRLKDLKAFRTQGIGTLMRSKTSSSTTTTFGRRLSSSTSSRGAAPSGRCRTIRAGWLGPEVRGFRRLSVSMAQQGRSTPRLEVRLPDLFLIDHATAFQIFGQNWNSVASSINAIFVDFRCLAREHFRQVSALCRHSSFVVVGIAALRLETSLQLAVERHHQRDGSTVGHRARHAARLPRCWDFLKLP